jgi:glycerol-3-phosphate dehydrogenase
VVTKTPSLDTSTNNTVDIFIIGGGANGSSISRDSVGLGLSVWPAVQGYLPRGTHSP